MNPRIQRQEKIEHLGQGRGEFDRDYTAILYSHAFRRLRHKTQVFFYSQNDHVCTRLDHSLYVATISFIVCQALHAKGIECEPMLASAIGLGHDLGHPPFGHAGEEVLNKLAKDIGGFKHERHSLRIVDKIEKPRNRKPLIGLNLTQAVRDGIVNHCGEKLDYCISPSVSPNLKGNSYPFTYEGCIVRMVDKIAYLGRDLEDAIIAGLIKETEIPGNIAAQIGSKNGEIVDFFVGDLIDNSNSENIQLSSKNRDLMEKLFKYNYERIYSHPNIIEYKISVKDILNALFDILVNKINEFEDDFEKYMKSKHRFIIIFGKFILDRKFLYFSEEPEYNNNELLYQRIVIDFLSTLTDNFAFQAIRELFLPKPII